MAKKIFKGKVVSNSMQKSIVVLINYQKQDRRFKKIIKRSKKVMAHDDTQQAKVGDFVSIQECPPVSRRKRFTLLDIIEKAK